MFFIAFAKTMTNRYMANITSHTWVSLGELNCGAVVGLSDVLEK